MSIQKTLGGDRLGSGKKMKVSLHNYERSTHDLSYIWRSTMSAGTLVPFLTEIALPGDTFDIYLDCDIKTHPTIGPLFGSYKVQLDVFLAPIRLYNALLHNNHLGIGLNMAQVKFPIIEMTALPNPGLTTDLDNIQINPSSLLSYLGMRGIGMNLSLTNKTRNFNATTILAYWEIVKNYYANKQEEIGAVIHTPAVALIQTVDDVVIYTTTPGDPGTSLQNYPATNNITLEPGWRISAEYTGTTPDPKQIMIYTAEHGLLSMFDLVGPTTDGGTAIYGYYNPTRWGNLSNAQYWRYRDVSDLNNGQPAVVTFPLSNIDQMRMNVLAFASTLSPFNITADSLEPYKFLNEIIEGVPNILSSQEGLALKTYQSDLFNNWLQTEWIDGTNGITAVTAIDTSGGSFTLDTLNLSKKVYEMLNRIAVSGGSYDDWLDAVYTHDRYMRAESPIYCGGLIRELVFQEVVSNSQSDDQPLGTLAGKGIMASKKKGGKIIIKCDEPSYIIGIISLTPRVDYSQGNKWDIKLQTLDDLHKPALDEIGFQELLTDQLAWWDTVYNETTSQWETPSAGKQPAWINYMTNVNVTRGNFAIQDNEMFMTLNRRYEAGDENGAIADLTTYIDPAKFNFIFAETALDAQNFWAQIAVDITARRKMSAKIMPNL